jgi:methylmalonyl-CoA/ethylmalonyl-CoA epimerase
MNGTRRTAAVTLAAFIIISIQGVYLRQTVAQDTGADFAIKPHHTGISVANLDESIAWYHKMLGFNVVRRMTQDANPKMSFALLRRDDCYLELFQVVDGKPLPEYRRDPTADLYVHGIKHFAYQVKDARAAAADLKSKGAEIALGPVENPNVVFVFIRDNSGNTFELIQFKQQNTPAPADS